MNVYEAIFNKGYPSETYVLIQATGHGDAIERAVANKHHTPNTITIHVEDYR